MAQHVYLHVNGIYWKLDPKEYLAFLVHCLESPGAIVMPEKGVMKGKPTSIEHDVDGSIYVRADYETTTYLVIDPDLHLDDEAAIEKEIMVFVDWWVRQP